MELRAPATEARREAILSAALDLFLHQGYEATTVEDIRAAAGASVGSIYHHFGCKEAIAAALFLRGVSDYQRQRLDIVQRTATAEEGVRASVEHYLDWVELNPKLARFMLTVEDRGVQAAVSGQLRELNKEFYGRLVSWRRQHVESGGLRRVPDDVYGHVLLGPAKAYVRKWVRGESSTTPRDAAIHFAEAAWRALMANSATAQDALPDGAAGSTGEATEASAEAWQEAVGNLTPWG